MGELHNLFAGIVAAHGAPAPRPHWADQEKVPFASHAAYLTLNQVRNALLECGHEVAGIDCQHLDGRHSVRIVGADGGAYRLTISVEPGQ